jgi:hypothetical protein
MRVLLSLVLLVLIVLIASNASRTKPELINMDLDRHLKPILAETVAYFDAQLSHYRKLDDAKRQQAAPRLSHQLTAHRKQIDLISKRIEAQAFDANAAYLIKLARYTLDVIETEIDQLFSVSENHNDMEKIRNHKL